MEILNIGEQHLAAVLRLNQLSVKVLSPLDQKKLQHLIAQATIAKVLICDGVVAAFIIGFEAGADYDSVNYCWFAQKYSRFLYIDRVVVDEAFRGRGMGAHIYNYILEFASDNNLPRLVAEIDIQPPNHASLRFHKRFNFIEIEQLAHHANKVVSLQYRSV